tara:strand:+ start:859 stop:1320 length:462 start_codon:yes stop_codon:yes gene_type:complete
MINIKALIESGEFYSLSSVDRYDEPLNARIRVENLYPLDWNDIDDIEDVEEIEHDANIWIMEICLVNLNKKKISIDKIKEQLRLVDEEEFEFDLVEDFHLCSSSEFAKSSKLAKLYSIELKPKIARSGAVAFELPDGFEELFLKIDDGILSEI